MTKQEIKELELKVKNLELEIELLKLKNSNPVPCPVPYPYYPVRYRQYDTKPYATWEISSTDYPITATPVIFI